MSEPYVVERRNSRAPRAALVPALHCHTGLMLAVCAGPLLLASAACAQPAEPSLNPIALLEGATESLPGFEGGLSNGAAKKADCTYGIVVARDFVGHKIRITI